MDEKISKLFLPLLDKLYNTEPAGEPFRFPVDPIKYGCIDYYLYVKNPIDLSTIRKKLAANQYKDAWRFVADIQIMFSNAYLFNKRGTPVYEFTNKLNKIWNQELTPIMQRLNYCCGTLHKFGPQLLFCLGTTQDKYCQIAIGAKYKCYQDSFSFCMPCFNRIETDHIDIQALTCETSRMNLPTEPVKKSDFVDCTNDHWQYEAFVNCDQCSRRIHQICDLYPAEDDELKACVQHDEIEEQQKSLCKVPPEFAAFAQPGPIQLKEEVNDASYENSRKSDCDHDGITEQVQQQNDTEKIERQIDQLLDANQSKANESCTDDDISDLLTTDGNIVSATRTNSIVSPSQALNNESLDDELLQFAKNVDDSHSYNWNPCSPQSSENLIRFDIAKDTTNTSHRDDTTNQVNNYISSQISKSGSISTNGNNAASNPKNSVDKIAARLSINKMSLENHITEAPKPSEQVPLNRDKFVCNHCYRKKRLGFNLRHRKYSARRLPHTRMSRYIETKVNEHIRENSPTAGEVTIRVLTAYRDKVEVKPEMKKYVQRCKSKFSTTQPNIDDYPSEFEYTNRAIFAWQEIDGVDVCVFGMHVQEYGGDCPEPNRQVVYLSYLDSVHFFRPKQVRTAVYHEILLSYFKYVKKLGFRRVFIWVCPSRKGDDYIFYRHPTEQKMPTLKRLSDWYVHLLDKGVISGIVERHHTVYDYAMTENWNSLMSMPYLSGDYWPGEFERLLNIMIESQKKYEEKLAQQKQQSQLEEIDLERSNPSKLYSISEYGLGTRHNATNFSQAFNDRSLEQHNILSLSSLYQRQEQTSSVTKLPEVKNSLLGSIGLKPTARESIVGLSLESGDTVLNASMNTEERFYEPFTPKSSKSDDQPLDLSKSSSNASPESVFDEDQMSEVSFQVDGKSRRKRRKSSSTMGYTKKRRANVTPVSQTSKSKTSQATCDGGNKFGKSPKAIRHKSGPQNQSGTDSLLDPEEELIKNFERSLKRQKDGFIVVRLSECDCSPHFENQRRKEEVTFSCDLMKGREPFLQLARLKKYEFSTLRRAKFSSLAMVKHLGQSFRLDPICNECFSFDSSKRHYACSYCEDYYLCTSCHENTHHGHIMSLMAPTTLPDIDEFLQQCSVTSAANSISSASSTISNKSFNETSLELPSQSFESPEKSDSSPSPPASNSNVNINHNNSIPLHRHLSNTIGSVSASMPLGCKRQRNQEIHVSRSRTEDEENANVNPFATGTTKLNLPNRTSPPPSHSSNSSRVVQVELDQVLIENFIRHAELTYSIDFDEMKSESKKLLTHYWSCPNKDTCCRCKFVILSCSFMSVLMRSTRMQMMINCNPNEGNLPVSGTSGTTSNSGSNNNGPNLSGSGMNLTTSHRFS